MPIGGDLATTPPDFVCVKDFGVVGDGENDDTAGIQRAIDAAWLGGLVWFPPGRYLVRPPAGASECLVMRRPCHLLGGGFYTAIMPAADVSDTIDTLAIRPDGTVAFIDGCIEGLTFGNPYDGTRHGRAGIKIDTTLPGGDVKGLKISRTFIGQGPGSQYSIIAENDVSVNPNGGFYCSTIENCQIYGGIKLCGTGDSNNILRNIISDYGNVSDPAFHSYNTIGIWASNAPGASCLAIEGNNITSRGGAILIDAGSRTRIVENNMECQTGPVNNNTIVDIRSKDGATGNIVIEGNLFGAFANTGILSCVRLANTVACRVAHNSFVVGFDGVYGVDVGEDARHTIVGANQSGGLLAPVRNKGNGTRGVFHEASLTNLFRHYRSGYQPVGYIKDETGRVHIAGAFRGGIVGAPIFTLPPEFRPASLHTLPIFKGSGLGTVTVNPDGTVVATDVSTGVIFNQMDLSFMAADCGWAASTL